MTAAKRTDIRLQPVQSKQDWDKFIDFPWAIYSGDAHWVPPLRIAVRDLLDVNKNPFFRHAYMHPLLALDETGKVVGRIVGVIDDHHNAFHREKTCFFGFYESIDDQRVANALLDAVARWGAERGMKTLRGPMNPSTNHECGLLIEGFDESPYVMMTYNPPYYAKLLEGWGLGKAKDLLAYKIRQESRFAERLLAQSEKLKQNSKITFRKINMRDFKNELKRVQEIYNDAWEKNWGFVPMDEVEFDHMAKDMKLILDPNLVLIAEVAGEPAGFALTLPDVNQAFKKIPDGKLLPLGLFKLLWHLKGPFKRKTINRCRILTLGIKKKYQLVGLGPLFYTEYLKNGPAMGYMDGEASWILEDNGPMNKALKLMGGDRTKVYRIYERPLTQAQPQ